VVDFFFQSSTTMNARYATAFGLLLAALTPGASIDLTTCYTVGESVRIDFVTEIVLERAEAESERETRRLARGSAIREHSRVDTWLACRDGRPTRIRRHLLSEEFEESASSSTTEGHSLRKGPLRDVVLELRLADGRCEVEVEEGSLGEQSVLERQALELATAKLLPEDEVVVGARWSLSEKDIRAALGGGLEHEPRLQTDGDEEFHVARLLLPFGFADLGVLLRSGKWSGQGKLESRSERAGVATVSLALDASGKLTANARSVFPPLLWEPADRFELEARGEAVFDLERRRPVKLVLKGEFRIEGERQGVWGGPQLHAEQEGRFSHSVSFSRAREDNAR
jgi:hypothetical protein